MTAKEVLEEHRSSVAALCVKYGVLRLRVFGSALSDRWDPARSDFDFAVEFDEPPFGVNYFRQQFGFLVDLEELLGRRVDVVDFGAAKKPHFRDTIEQTGWEFYAA